jgi:hypothetical protein
MSFHGEATVRLIAAPAIGECLTGRAVSWKNVMKSGCDQRIWDHSSQIDRCPN